MRSVSWPGQVVVKLGHLARLQKKKGVRKGLEDPTPTQRVASGRQVLVIVP